MLSPLTRDESCTSRLTTSAPSRLAASSNDTRVRVDGSVKRLATVTPASCVLTGGGCPRGRTKRCASSRRCSIISRGRVSSVSRWRREPSARSCPEDSMLTDAALTGEPALENDRCGGAVNVFSSDATAPLAASSTVGEPCAGLERGEAFIHVMHFETEARLELGAEAARRSGERAGTAVIIIRDADDEHLRLQAADLVLDAYPIRSVAQDLHRGAGRGT